MSDSVYSVIRADLIYHLAVSILPQAVFVEKWEDLPQLLERLAQMTDDEVNQLQVIGIKGTVIG